MIIMGRPKISKNLVHISLAIEEADLAFWDRESKKHEMSRSRYLSSILQSCNPKKINEYENRIKSLHEELESMKKMRIHRLKPSVLEEQL